jgi:RNA polymerase sigma-70 factor (ECF subfamily)
MSATPTTRLEDLLGHADWLRRLAAHLVRDASETDDLMQETWEAALRRPPDAGRSPRPWLAEVLRNLVRGRKRRRRLHRQFEAQSAVEPAAVPSPEVLLERAEAHRLVAELVIGLDEPYRGTLLLRYHEGLSGAQIAHALGVPPGTVRWRLKVGLDRVRAGLRERQAAWTIALLPVEVARRPWEGALVMGAKTKLGIAGGILAAAMLLGGLLVRSAPARKAAPPGETPRRASASVVPRAVLQAWARAGAGRAGEIEGTVHDPGGLAVAGAQVALVVSGAYEEMDDGTALRPRAAMVAGVGGAFRFTDVTPGVYLVTATARGWAPAEQPGVVLLPGESLNGIDLRLGRGSVQLRGQISDAGGGPVAGASVRALALGAGRRPAGARTFIATSDDKGRYAVDLARGSYRVVADGDGYVPSAMEVVLDGDQRHDFRLMPAARISGRVIERGAGPARGALVRLRADALIKAQERTATADRDGAFAFSGVPPGSFFLSARSAGLVARSALKVTVPIAGAASDVVIELVPGNILAGKVVDDRRAPIPGARVHLDSDRASVSSAADGRYHLEGVSAGKHLVTAEATGHGPAQVSVAIDGDDRDGVDLVLGAESTVTGRVIGRNGAAIAGASVTALVTHGDALSEVVASAAVSRSDPSGRFSLSGLGAGDVRVEAEHPDHGRGLAGPSPLAEGATRTIDVRLGRGGMIRGAVRWDDASPAAGVIVDGRQLGRPGSTTAADLRGRYELGPFPPGEVRVGARPEIDPLGSGGDVQRVLLAVGEDRDGVDLVLPRYDQEISGVVVAPDGTPSPGATVGAAADHRGVSWRPYNKYARDEAGNYTVLSEADGSFTVKHLPGGTFTVWATQPGLPEGDAFGVPAGSHDVRVRLTEGATISGRVVTRSGTAVTNYTVYAMLSRTNDATPALRAARGYVQEVQPIQDPTGRFELTGLHPAVHDLLVTTPSGLGGRLDGIALVPGERKQDVRVTVGDVVRVKGHVVDARDRRPLAEVVVVGWLAMLKEQVTARSDASGTFVLDGVVPGTIDLSFRGPPGSKQAAQVSISVPDGQRELDAGDFALR